MSRELVNTRGLYEDAPYSYAAVAPPGSSVFTAGACPIDSEGRVADPGDLVNQTRLTLDNLTAALRAAGCGLEDVVKTTVEGAQRPARHLGAGRGALRQRRPAEHAARRDRPRLHRPARGDRGGGGPALNAAFGERLSAGPLGDSSACRPWRSSRSSRRT